MANLPAAADSRPLVGLRTRDDAAVYRVSGDRVLVQTLDIFTPFVDDPYAYGAIAAANSLSDIYAMGADPALALNFLAYPRAHLSREVVVQIVRGGADKMTEAGVVIGGGHSIEDREVKFGYAVTGFTAADRIVTNAGARPGDRLVLTKPIGLGVVTTGIKYGRTSEETVESATQVMLQLNGPAVAAMLAVGVHACTDVTGYGLIGHLREMAEASRVAARLRVGAVPVLEEAWVLARAGVVPGGSQRNRAAAEGYVRWSDAVSEEARVLLCDAQTSGGLLIAVAPERIGALRAALTARGVRVAAEVGEVLDSGEGWIEVVA